MRWQERRPHLSRRRLGRVRRERQPGRLRARRIVRGARRPRGLLLSGTLVARARRYCQPQTLRARPHAHVPHSLALLAAQTSTRTWARSTPMSSSASRPLLACSTRSTLSSVAWCLTNHEQCCSQPHASPIINASVLCIHQCVIASSETLVGAQCEAPRQLRHNDHTNSTRVLGAPHWNTNVTRALNAKCCSEQSKNSDPVSSSPSLPTTVEL